jgi:Asp-tRNA(Asn)/Glu-tRNA(Gln) amidotransferase A subunit family amidase
LAELQALSAAEQLALYRRGETSPVEVAQATLDHIARWEPQLNALYAFEPERVLQQARASEARWRAGTAGALDGVPCTIKENIATAGTPVPAGTAATVLAPAVADAPPAARLREAGAVLLAKTTMPDWGMLSSGLSTFHPLTRNPWHLASNPGGSSAGAGAAAAAGYGPLHIGTDIGGSIRLPAAWCGVLGFKPSNGRVPIYPPYAGRAAGPMTRTVTDAALMMQVLARPDARDTMSLPPQAIAWTALDIDLKGLRLGLQLDAGWGLPVEPAVQAAIEAAARRFEAAGATVTPLPAFCTRAMADGMDHFWRMRSWLDFSALPPERQDRVLPYLRQWIAAGAQLSGTQVFQGYSAMGLLREAAVAACAPFDFVLSPVSPNTRFPAGWASPINDPARPFEHIAFTLPYNMSEQPAISVDAGRTPDGAPIGLQIAGRRHDDLGVLRLARAWEQLRDPPPAWPEPPVPPPAA